MFKAILTALLTAATVSACVFVPTSLYNNSTPNRDLDESNRSYAVLPAPPSEVPGGKEDVFRYNFVLNEQRSVRPGEAVLRVQAFKKYETLLSQMRLDEKAEIQTETRKIVLSPGVYPIYGIIETEGEPYYLLAPRGSLFPVIDMSGVLQNRMMDRLGSTSAVSFLPERVKLTPKNVRLKRVVQKRENSLPFTDYEIVYDGIKNNMMAFFAKYSVPGTNGEQGHFETLTYPKDATTISLRGGLIRIIRADREKLDYVVLTNPK